MEKLISWDGKHFSLTPDNIKSTRRGISDWEQWGPRTQGTYKQVEELVAQPRRKEIVRFVNALSAYFGAIGMHKVCKKCFAGDPKVIEYSHGECCSPCALLGETSCVSKPLGCAMWMCNYTETLFPKARKLLDKIHARLREAGGLTRGCFLPGRLDEQEAHKRLSFRQKWVLASISRVLEREVINSGVNQQT